MRAPLLVATLALAPLVVGCGDSGDSGADLVVQDLSAPGTDQGAGNTGDLGPARDSGGDGGTGPSADLGPVRSGAFTVLGGGTAFRDASSDQGGNVWAISTNRVYFFRRDGGVTIYDTGSGLARGQTTWTDAYWCLGQSPCPTTNPVEFSAVAGGVAGQAFVGNIGYLGDRLDVDPRSGAVRAVVGLEVGPNQQANEEERAAQQQREVATWRAVIDLNGTFDGTAYFGGFHGTSALHGLSDARGSGRCNCPDFEEHVHPFSLGGDDVFGGDVHAAFVTPRGDVWLGDRKAIYLLPQRSLGPVTDLFVDFVVIGPGGSRVIDVFPGVDDWNVGIAEDGEGGVWVASHGSGLAYLAPRTRSITYFDANSGDLPSDTLTGLDIDAFGAVWIATESDGAVRYTPEDRRFTRFTVADGLPSNSVRQVQADKHGGADHAVYFATANGVAVYLQP